MAPLHICAELNRRSVALRKLTKDKTTPFHSPRVVGHDAKLGILAVRWKHGKSLLECLRDGSGAEVLRDTAAALSAWHGIAIADLPQLTPRHQCADLDDAVHDLAHACPEAKERLETIAAALRPRINNMHPDRAVTLHNDLHAQQMGVQQNRITFLDLERMAMGDPCVDVASLVTQLRMLGHRPEMSVDPADAEQWANTFLEAWERVTGSRIDAARLHGLSILALLRLARGMMRHLRPGWREFAGQCLARAEIEWSAMEHEGAAR
jgi:aminoglycoside phosphotransferase (APT) family kinase protein